MMMKNKAKKDEHGENRRCNDVQRRLNKSDYLQEVKTISYAGHKFVIRFFWLKAR
jgi:hypothetical protein